MADKKCSQLGCVAPKDWESKYCGKHSCGKCYGVGKLQPSYGVKLTCHVCNGSGKNNRASL